MSQSFYLNLSHFILFHHIACLMYMYHSDLWLTLIERQRKCFLVFIAPSWNKVFLLRLFFVHVHNMRNLSNGAMELNRCSLWNISFGTNLVIYVNEPFLYLKAHFDQTPFCWLIPPGQIGRHFAHDSFNYIFMSENFCILVRIALKFVPKGPIDNNPAFGSGNGSAPKRRQTISSILTQFTGLMKARIQPNFYISLLLQKQTNQGVRCIQSRTQNSQWIMND